MSELLETPAEPGAGQAAADHGAHHREVAREGGWAGLFSLLGSAVRYGNNLILTRMMGAKYYGLYVLANTVVTVVTIPASLGLPTALVHFLASGSSTGQWGKVRWMIRTALWAALISSVVGVALILALSPWACDVVFKKQGLRPFLIGLSFAVPFLVLYSVCAGGLQGFRKIRAKVFIEKVAHPLVFSVLLLMGALFLRTWTFIIVCFVIAAAAVFLMAALWFRRQVAALPRVPGPEASHWRELRSFSIPVMFMNLLSFLLLKSDVLVMGGFRNATELGIYFLAANLALGVTLPTDSLGVSLAPSFSALMGQGDIPGLRRLFHTSTRWLFLLAGAVGVGLAFSGELLLHLFGKDFRGGFVVLCILVGGQMFSAALGASGTLITMTGHPKVNIVNSIFMGLGNFCLLMVLVPRFGGLGAATAAATSMVGVNLARAVEIWFILRIGPWDRTILKPMLVLLVALLLGGSSFYAFGPWVATPVGLGAFALCWWGLRPEPEDADMFRRGWSKLRRHPA